MDDTVLEQHSFGAEVGRLLDLVVHSLYSEREIFLRELVANAADAVDSKLPRPNPQHRPILIGQFGVGFYSAFMVADRVEVTSRKAGSEEAFTWASEGAGQFTLAPATREQPGTDILLHIK